MAVKNPIFKILRCPGCGKQNWHTELLASIPACPKCGGSPTYSPDWYIKVIVDGKRHIQAIGRQKQHAESALKKAEAEIFYDAYQINQESPLLSEAITALYDARWRKKKDGQGVKRRAELLQEIIGNVPICTIGKRHMKRLADTLAAKGTKDSTVNRYRGVLRSILKYHGLPTKFITMDEEIEGRIRVITDQEELQILNLFAQNIYGPRGNFSPEMYAACICLVDTGMRAGELFGLPPKDINFTTNMITIWRNKAEKPRSVPMTNRTREILKKRIDRAGGRLFGLNVIQADAAWNWARAQMGLQDDGDFVVHALRHTCATRLLIAGVDVYRVKEWLGHKTIKTTLRYIHLAPHNLNSALTALENRNRQHAVNKRYNILKFNTKKRLFEPYERV